MGLFKHYKLTSSTRIQTSPENVWNFFYNLEDNYENWHPDDHHYWKWTKGKPLAIGSKIDSKETIDGHSSRIKAVVTESIENEKIVLKPCWPISIMCPKLEWIIKKEGNGVHFIAHTYYKFGKLFLLFKKDSVNQIIEITRKHMDEEGENLKNILEQQY